VTGVQERSRSRRQRLLAAALDVFTAQGYSETAIDQVAKASDTSKGGLYFHFPSKQALFIALLDESSVALLRRVESAMAVESDPLARGEAALFAVLSAFGEHRMIARLLLVEAVGAGKEFNAKLNTLHSSFTSIIASCLDEAVDTGQIAPLDTRIAADAWYGAVNHVVLRWLMTGEPERLQETFPALRELLRNGVYGCRQADRP
jgi:AcrR family transcriptional regulator